MTHENLVGSFMVNKEYLMRYMSNGEEEETYIAYLPAAHIFENQLELLMVSEGVKVGFSSPQTLTDTSPKIVRGCKGDASILKPRYIIAVPTVLDRVYKAINNKLAKSGPVSRQEFQSGKPNRIVRSV